MLELIDVNRSNSGEIIVQNINVRLQPGTTNILLGPTLSGKTSLLRLMAGLDKPDSGDVRFNGESVLGIPVQKRNVAMVYQQFINYPSLSVFDNIASPLRVARVSRKQIQERVAEAAELLQIDQYLKKLPAELSGGQQQRVALARALVKRAQLVLLDEPLANLDYKLREELRVQLPQLFHEHGSILVYATTEPLEALVLNGNVMVMCEGGVAQVGDTLSIYRAPANLIAAAAFSDPPLNIAAVVAYQGTLSLAGTRIELSKTIPDGRYTIGIRPHQVRLNRQGEQDVEIRAHVIVNEITGSESFVHFEFEGHRWVLLVHGICEFTPDVPFSCFVDPADFFLFDAASGITLKQCDNK